MADMMGSRDVNNLIRSIGITRESQRGHLHFDERSYDVEDLKARCPAADTYIGLKVFIYSNMLLLPNRDVIPYTLKNISRNTAASLTN